MREFDRHGLIVNMELEAAYIAAVPGRNTKEHASVHLMEDLLKHQDSPIYIGKTASCNSQYYPSKNSDQHCDLVVQYLGTSARKEVLALIECKRPDKVQRRELEKLEDQLLNYCKLHIEETESDYVYGAASVGVKLRVFKYEKGDKDLTPMWGKPLSAGEGGGYMDVGDNQEAERIRLTFKNMHEFPPTLAYGQSSESYGTTTLTKPVPRREVQVKRVLINHEPLYQYDDGDVTLRDRLSEWKQHDGWLVSNNGHLRSKIPQHHHTQMPMRDKIALQSRTQTTVQPKKSLQIPEFVKVDRKGDVIQILSGKHKGESTRREDWKTARKTDGSTVFLLTEFNVCFAI